MTELRRVIGCQGSIQLITATNAVEHHQATRPDIQYKNYLLVYELYSPHGQDVDFFKFIKKLALSGPIKFENILYLNAEAIQGLHEEYLKGGLNSAREKLRSLTGIDRADELFLTSNWHPGNKIVMNCLPSASTICYGDSIGLYIPEDYFNEKNNFSTLKKNKVVKSFMGAFQAFRAYQTYPSRRPRLKALKSKKFNLGYYLTLSLTAEKPNWPVIFINKRSLLETFNKYVQGLTFDLGKDPILHESALAFILTTNFSEAQKMSLENEILAYHEYVNKHIEKGTAIVVKPHPRDSQLKLKMLESTLKTDYKVKILNNDYDSFIPFELTLIMFKSIEPGKFLTSRYYTFSSSCLSIKILFDQNPQVGLGSALVNKYFQQTHKRSRVQHEQDLQRLLSSNYH